MIWGLPDGGDVLGFIQGGFLGRWLHSRLRLDFNKFKPDFKPAIPERTRKTDE